mgnify:CR=1 FL=1
MFTQEAWDALRRERTLNKLAALLEPELLAALGPPTCRSLARGPVYKGMVKASTKTEGREGGQVRVIRDGHGEVWYKDGRMVGFRSPVTRR